MKAEQIDQQPELARGQLQVPPVGQDDPVGRADLEPAVVEVARRHAVGERGRHACASRPNRLSLFRVHTFFTGLHHPDNKTETSRRQPEVMSRGGRRTFLSALDPA